MQRVIKRSVPSVRKVKYVPKYDAIIGSDPHIREDVPICRTDDYLSAQYTKMAFIRDLCMDNNNAPFLCAGDLFDVWHVASSEKKVSWLLSKCLEFLPAMTIVVPGQHDLANHSLKELPKTGLQTLVQAGRVLILSGGFQRVLGDPTHGLTSVSGYAYGEVAKNVPKSDKNRKHILLWHRLTCVDKQPFPDAGAERSHILLKSLSGYDLIVTGDNHQQFHVESTNERRHLVNPGSMMRMSADQIDFEPAVFGWCAKDNSITRIPLPIKKGVVSREHLNKEKKETRDLRMSAYIKRAQKSYETKLSYTENLKRHIKKNKVGKEVEELVWEAVGE